MHIIFVSYTFKLMNRLEIHGLKTIEDILTGFILLKCAGRENRISKVVVL